MDKMGSKRRGRDGQSESSGAGRGGPTNLKFTISSDHTASLEVQRQILTAIARHEFNEQSTFAIRIALTEAMTNAIKHGNRLDSSKKVHIKATVSAKECEIVIEDEGSGFNRAAVPDPTLHENLEKCSGRGIHLIEAYMNEVDWSRGGKKLRMLKRNEPDTLPRG
jgi:serine/threonine-protein kinase RsbW